RRSRLGDIYYSLTTGRSGPEWKKWDPHGSYHIRRPRSAEALARKKLCAIAVPRDMSKSAPIEVSVFCSARREPIDRIGRSVMRGRKIWVPSSVIASAAALAALLEGMGPAAAETLLERGSYLVNAVMAYDGCHTPRGLGSAFVMEKHFSGGSQTGGELAVVVKGSNITPDLDTGIGVWSEDDLKRALIDGVRPAQRALGAYPSRRK